MDSKQRYISVFTICIAIVAAAALIAYKPWAPERAEDLFRYPVGVPPSLGTVASTWVGDEQVYAIYVSGSGSTSEQANQATVTLGVMTEDEDASEAVEDNAVLMNAVIEAIKTVGIPDDKIKTVTYSVYPNYDWELRTTTGYRVTNMVQVEVDDLDLVGEAIDSASGAGANNIQGISFELSDDIVEELQNEAYVSALEDARGKAELIAKTLGLEITGVLSVSENVYYPYTPYRSFAEPAPEAAPVPAPTQIIEGTLSVSVSVQVAFTFENLA